MSARVAIERQRTYVPRVVEALACLFDRIGGIGALVRGKTVAIKVNLGGEPDARVGCLPIGSTTWVHQDVIAGVVFLLGKAGAQRIRLLEGPWNSADPLEERILRAGIDPRRILGAAARVEFENTNCLGSGKEYCRLKVPRGGLIFPSFDLNHSYTDCDVFVSLAKLKEHMSTGLTLTMKNCFGITPCTIYGDSAGEREPSPFPIGGRVNVMHHGKRQPSASAASERDPSTPREDGYRVPRIVTDLVAARPVDLAILDAIETMTGGEGPYPWAEPVAPGLLIAGTNCVAVDAVAAAAIGFDPMAARGTEPFLDCDNTIALGEAAGAGPRDFNRIDVAGWKPGEVPFDFRPLRRRWRERQAQKESARGSRFSPRGKDIT